MINKKPAFTLVEVITVLLVISLGMIGTLSLISQNIRSQNVNENTMIAYQLAQEGIELVRNIRDTNWNYNNDWRTGMDTDGLYTMDYTSTLPTKLVTQSQGDLYLDTNGMYAHGLLNSPKSGFNRVISIAAAPAAENMKYITVTVNVSWNDHGKPYVYSLDTQLYDWK
jgi:prepilin-type N-terminal cleavage/methylation domain-containing protein